MVLEHNVSLFDNTVAMSVEKFAGGTGLTSSFGNRVWISSTHVASVAAKNFRIVHAASDYFYLVSPPCVGDNVTSLLLLRIVVREDGLGTTLQGGQMSTTLLTTCFLTYIKPR